MSVAELQTERAAKFIEGVFHGYLIDPADSDFQRGFLSCALAIYRSGLAKGEGDDRLTLLDRQVQA